MRHYVSSPVMHSLWQRTMHSLTGCTTMSSHSGHVVSKMTAFAHVLGSKWPPPSGSARQAHVHELYSEKQRYNSVS